MATTQEEWYKKLKGWVPDWFFEEQNLQEAHFQAFAKLLNTIELKLEDHVRETFICQAEGSFLDEHGTERNVERLLNELNTTMCNRVRNLVNTSDRISIKQIVDDLLVSGVSTIVEEEDNVVFLDSEVFVDRGIAFAEIFYNFFTIIIDKQVRTPSTFFGREDFGDREDFYGQDDSDINLLQTIVEAVNRAKAFGVLWRLIERSAT